MPSFSRRHIETAATPQLSESAPEAGHSAETVEHVSNDAAERPAANSDRHAAREDVDFDTAIAEVLMTLAADRGAAGDMRPTDEHPQPASHASEEREHALGFYDDEEEDEDEATSPEALLAAEAATFRLLSELDRLWHRAA